MLGVLMGQKPQKNRRKMQRHRQILKWAFLTGSLVMIAAGIWLVAQKPFAKKVVPKISWQVVVHETNGLNLSESKTKRIVKIAGSVLRTGEEKELRAVARQIQQSGEFAKVHVLRTAHNKITVGVSERTGVMSIEADKVRQLSKEGVVFGELPESSTLPLLRGVFDNRPEAFAFRDDQSLDLTDDEGLVIGEALELWRDGTQAGFAIKALEYKRFRGFFVTFSNSEVEVALGRSPFKEKFGRLQEIIDRLEKSGGHAARIELDYQGKAFIKEKKM